MSITKYSDLFIIPVKDDYDALTRCLQNIETLKDKESLLVAIAVNGEPSEENVKSLFIRKKFKELNIVVYDYTDDKLSKEVHRSNQYLGNIRSRALGDSFQQLNEDAVIYLIDADCVLSENYLSIGKKLRETDYNIGISRLEYVAPKDDIHIQKHTSENIRNDFNKLIKKMYDAENSLKNALKLSSSPFWCCRVRAFQINFKLSWFVQNQLPLDPGPHIMNEWVKRDGKVMEFNDCITSSEFRDSDRVTNGIGNDVNTAFSNYLMDEYVAFLKSKNLLKDQITKEGLMEAFKNPTSKTFPKYKSLTESIPEELLKNGEAVGFANAKTELVNKLRELIVQNKIPREFRFHRDFLYGRDINDINKDYENQQNQAKKINRRYYNIVVNNNFERLVQVLSELSWNGSQDEHIAGTGSPHSLFSVTVTGGETEDNAKSVSIIEKFPRLRIIRIDRRQQKVPEFQLRAEALNIAKTYMDDNCIVMDVQI